MLLDEVREAEETLGADLGVGCRPAGFERALRGGDGALDVSGTGLENARDGQLRGGVRDLRGAVVRGGHEVAVDEEARGLGVGGAVGQGDGHAQRGACDCTRVQTQDVALREGAPGASAAAHGASQTRGVKHREGR